MDFIRYKDDGLDICHTVDFDDDLEIFDLIKKRIERQSKMKKELQWPKPKSSRAYDPSIYLPNTFNKDGRPRKRHKKKIHTTLPDEVTNEKEK